MIRTSDRIDVVDGIHLTAIDYSDAESLAQYLNEKEYSANTCSIPFPYKLSDAKEFIRKVINFEMENNLQRDWVIRRADGSLIGGIGLLYERGIQAHRSELGYWLAKAYWNKGIMTAVLKSFTNYIFLTRSIVRLEALVFVYNPSSCRALERAGFQKEGFLHKAYKKESQYLDAWLYAMVR